MRVPNKTIERVIHSSYSYFPLRSLSLLHTHTLASKSCHHCCVNIGVVLYIASSLSSEFECSSREDKRNMIFKKVGNMISKGHR